MQERNSYEEPVPAPTQPPSTSTTVYQEPRKAPPEKQMSVEDAEKLMQDAQNRANAHMLAAEKAADEIMEKAASVAMPILQAAQAPEPESAPDERAPDPTPSAQGSTPGESVSDPLPK